MITSTFFFNHFLDDVLISSRNLNNENFSQTTWLGWTNPPKIEDVFTRCLWCYIVWDEDTLINHMSIIHFEHKGDSQAMALG